MKKQNTNVAEIKALIEEVTRLTALMSGANLAPAKEAAKVPSKAQLEAREKFAANAKAAAARRSTFKSPEYKVLWEKWKKDNAKKYDAASNKAEKKELNHNGHVWVMAQLEAPKKKPAAKKAPAKKESAAKNPGLEDLMAQYRKANAAAYKAVGDDARRIKEMDDAGRRWAELKLKESAAPKKSKRNSHG